MIWAALTRRPRASLDELAALSGLPRSTVHDAVYALRDAGYIDFEDGAKRARHVLIPFIITRKERS